MTHLTTPAARSDAPPAPLPTPLPERRRDDGGRSKVTATARLLLAVWLIASGARTLADPQAAADAAGAPQALLLRLAAVHFTLGMFLLSGFMSRVCGLFLVVLGIYEGLNVGWTVAPPLFMLVGVYLALRGGGTWAMDVYVQKMQDRVRLREARERAAAEAAAASASVHADAGDAAVD